jgi:hypothetical protein
VALLVSRVHLLMLAKMGASEPGTSSVVDYLQYVSASRFVIQENGGAQGSGNDTRVEQYGKTKKFLRNIDGGRERGERRKDMRCGWLSDEQVGRKWKEHDDDAWRTG